MGEPVTKITGSCSQEPWSWGLEKPHGGGPGAGLRAACKPAGAPGRGGARRAPSHVSALPHSFTHSCIHSAGSQGGGALPAARSRGPGRSRAGVPQAGLVTGSEAAGSLASYGPWPCPRTVLSPGFSCPLRRAALRLVRTGQGPGRPGATSLSPATGRAPQRALDSPSLQARSMPTRARARPTHPWGLGFPHVQGPRGQPYPRPAPLASKRAGRLPVPRVLPTPGRPEEAPFCAHPSPGWDLQLSDPQDRGKPSRDRPQGLLAGAAAQKVCAGTKLQTQARYRALAEGGPPSRPRWRTFAWGQGRTPPSLGLLPQPRPLAGAVSSTQWAAEPAGERWQGPSPATNPGQLILRPGRACDQPAGCLIRSPAQPQVLWVGWQSRGWGPRGLWGGGHWGQWGA